MYKKVVVLGGGTGISFLLKGLKDFPLDITAVITVADNGKSTGILREEFNTPAVGDIRKVISNLSSIDPAIKQMMEYRFHTSSDLNGHALGNLILTAMLDITGSLSDSIAALSKLLDVRHKVLPISEDCTLTLMGETIDGQIIEGETELAESHKKFKRVFYKKDPEIVEDVLKAIKEADLILLSMGSLYTSIIPHLICPDVVKAIDESNANVMYLCNAMTQPGETDHFGVSDHVKVLNEYLKEKKIDAVIASNTKINPEIAKKYETKEQKDPVFIDRLEFSNMDIELIEDDLLIIDEDGTLKHNSLKLSSIIFSYLMRD